jgi:hypothetical protein
MLLLLMMMLLLIPVLVVTAEVVVEDTNVEVSKEEPISIVISKPPHEMESILTLTDESFEHTTQASTGQTTGSWLVWFYNSTTATDNNDDDTTTNIPFRGTFPSMEQWLEHHMIVAKIDVATNGYHTMERFFGKKTKKKKPQQDSIPSLIYLHQGKMYLVPMVQYPPPSYYDWDIIYTFCQEPNPLLGLPIPKPPSVMHEIITKLANNPSLFSAVAVMIMICGAFIGTLIESFTTTKKTKKSITTKPQEPQQVVSKKRN